MEKIYLIIHGHFYQPPREDPWTLSIDFQPSAFPYHDWNQRINRECYAANSASRVLDDTGRIIDIINNYEYISFNFGPTLLSWIKKNDMSTFEKIIEADKKSMEKNNGHGNAIAQVYNHIILPLAKEKDIITEIEWGLRAFEIDFGRKAEGIWLPETAINERVAEILIDYNIKFVILSPYQAEEVYYADRGEWINVSDGSIDPSRPYILEQRNGKLNIFFYYKEIATKVSFQHLLRNVEFLRSELLKYKQSLGSSRLIHYATDGEIYGHHEPFGDMCLARLIYENRMRDEFVFTNYANYLEIFPPRDLVRLKKGNEGLGTSWSCVHGVDRWRKDCGCTEGSQPGWNQKWRTPLREAFDFIRDKLFEKATEILTPLITDIWKLRNEYINYIYNTSEKERKSKGERLLSNYLRKSISDEEKVTVMKFLQALHMELLMYTSCGWFFADISGIETIQNMKYAFYLLNLMEGFFSFDVKERFLEILDKAKSNIENFGNGRQIFENFVVKKFLSLKQILLEYILLKIFNFKTKNGFEYHYYYHIEVLDEKEEFRNNIQVKSYVCELEDTIIGSKEKYLLILINYQHRFYAFIKKYKDEYFLSYIHRLIKKIKPENIIFELKEWLGDFFTLMDISYDIREKIINLMFEEKMRNLHKYIEISKNEFLNYLGIIELYGELDIRIPEKDRIIIREILNNIVLNELEKIEKIEDFSTIIKIFQIAKKAKLKLDYNDILPVIRNYILKIMDDAILKFNRQTLMKLEKVIDFTNMAGLEFEKYEIQNLLFSQVKKIKSNTEKFDRETVRIFFEIARKFNIGVDEI